MNLVDQPAPEVEIEQGILSGIISTDGSFFEYIGIPYATTNSSTRFKVSILSITLSTHAVVSTDDKSNYFCLFSQNIDIIVNL